MKTNAVRVAMLAIISGCLSLNAAARIGETIAHGLHRLLHRGQNQKAQSVTEYAVILALVAMLAVVILRSIGTTTNNSMVPVNDALQ